MCHKQIIQCFPRWKTWEINYEVRHLPFTESEVVQSPFRNTGFQSLINLIYMKHLPGSWREMMFGNISTGMIFRGELVMSLSGCVDSWQGRLYCSWFTKASLQARILNSFKPWVVFKLKETNKCTQVLVFASSVSLAMPPSCICKAVLSLTALWHGSPVRTVFSAQQLLRISWTLFKWKKTKQRYFLLTVTSSLSELFQCKVIYGWEWTFIGRTFVLKMILRRVVSV